MERSSESPGHKSDIEQKKNYKTIDLELQETIRTITTSTTELKNYCGSISIATAQLTWVGGFLFTILTTYPFSI